MKSGIISVRMIVISCTFEPVLTYCNFSASHKHYWTDHKFSKIISIFPNDTNFNAFEHPVLFPFGSCCFFSRVGFFFNPFPNKPWFLCVCSTSLLKTLWEKEKLLVTSNFSFSRSVFYLFGELSAIFMKLEIVV